MASFYSDGIEIAYESHGEGKPVVLVHGFASNGRVNWVETGWVEALNEAGYRAVIMDNRGHGDSEKLYDPDKYPAREMAGDVARLIHHLGIGPAPVMGYSMGARITAFVALDNPDAISAAIFGGLGINMVHGMRDPDEIISALQADSVDEVSHPTGRQFRHFAEHTGSDLQALAACMQSSRDPIAEEDVRRIEVPALVAVGSEDEVAGSPGELADLLPHGEALVIERRDHMRATGDKKFKAGVLEFLAQVTS